LAPMRAWRRMVTGSSFQAPRPIAWAAERRSRGLGGGAGTSALALPAGALHHELPVGEAGGEFLGALRAEALDSGLR